MDKDIERYLAGDATQFEDEFRTMDEMERLRLLRLIDEMAYGDTKEKLREHYKRLLHYTLEANQLFRYYGVPWPQPREPANWPW